MEYKNLLCKKNIIIGILIVLIILIFIIFKPKNNSKVILVESDTIVIKENEIYSLKKMLYNSNNQIDISIDDLSVAKLTEENYIKGISNGSTTINLKTKHDNRKIKLIVSNDELEVENIKILDKDRKLNIDDQYLYEVKFEPELSYENDLEWTSSDENVAKIDDGVITIIGNGKTIIKVLTNNQKYDSFELTISDKKASPLKDINFKDEIINLSSNSTYLLEPIFSPMNVTNKNIEYIIEDENIVNIENSKIVAKNEGTTKIIAKIENISKELIVNVKSNIKKQTIALNETVKLKTNNKNIIDWYSTNEKIVEVDNGTIRGINEGVATVTAINTSNKFENFEITVKGTGTLATSIVNENKNLSMIVGTSYQLDSYVMPANAINKNIIWETTDSRIATINDNGLIVAKAVGAVNILGYTSNNIGTVIKLTVDNKQIDVSSVELSSKEISLKKGDTYKLYLNVIPYNAKYSVSWSSDNNNVATVENGIINAVGLGQTIIRVKCNSEILTANIKVEDNIIDISSIDTISDISIYENEEYSLNIKYLPTNATNKTFTFLSSNPNIATVSSEGKIKGIKEGVTNITVSSANGVKKNVNVTIKTKIQNNPNPSTEPSNIQLLLNYTNLVMKEDETKQLRATIIPTTNRQNVSWYSDNDGVATVSENGTLVAVSAGSATIAAVYDANHIARMKLTVEANETGVSINGVMIMEPVEGEIANGFNDKHDGVDIFGNSMTPIKACGKGIVTFSKSTNSVGKVFIEHANGVRTFYYHLEKVYVQVGQEVKQGDIIGGMGDKGGFGVHLHLSIKINGQYVNPANYLYRK